MIVGIDLGTTNSVLAYLDTGEAAANGAAPSGAPSGAPSAPPSAASSAARPTIHHFQVPQVVEPGHTAPRPLLPSYLYLAGEHDLPEGSLDLPWASGRTFAVGEFARERGGEVPGRVVASAKSWLRHREVDRTAAILPWEAPEDVPRLSPLTAQARILEHLRDAWNDTIASRDPSLRLEAQEVLLGVPASFDPAARELTARAAAAAGFVHLTLLEEPQAAFYAWLQSCGEGWREELAAGDRVLVCDVGGGTTDFTLIGARDERGELVLDRIAVGDHILLGGDNMDLALAHALAAKLAVQGHQLDAWQMRSLWHLARAAKERLLADTQLDAAPIVILGRGAKLVGGSIRTELRRSEVEEWLTGGFFPLCGPADRPVEAPPTGLRELGLPYEADPGVTRHLAQFIARSRENDDGAPAWPTALLLNGGVMKSPVFAARVAGLLREWSGARVRVLAGADLDLAVATGAVYYGFARRGHGVRIRGGTSRAYYVGIESALPAVPGVPAPLKAICVAPLGMEEGTDAKLPGREFALVTGERAVFRFFASARRSEDRIGAMVESWEMADLEELEPVVATLAPPAGESAGGESGAGESAGVATRAGAPTHAGAAVPVKLESRVTELGILELWCVSRDGSRRWKLEYEVRARPQAAEAAR
jgi:molecular chaperone DnaK (HSP70)